jgi:urease accessory protein UreH
VTANRLRLEAQARGGRTIVSRIRGEGLLRASRPFHEGTASRIVVAHLGPGMIRGDAFATGGSVAPGAHLIVAGQMATRVLSGPEPARCDAVWHVGSGGTLDLQSEPVLVGAGTAYVGTTALHLAPGARVRVRELVSCERGARVRATLIGQRETRIAFVDALALDGEVEAHAVGTLLFAGPVDLAALDACADALRGVRAGVGVLRDGDVLVRVAGAGVREVAAALDALRDVPWARVP